MILTEIITGRLCSEESYNFLSGDARSSSVIVTIHITRLSVEAVTSAVTISVSIICKIDKKINLITH